MPVDTLHPSLTPRILRDWRTIRDVLDGESKIKAAGEAYLPRLAEQTDDEYASYLARAVFFGATERTHEAMVGLIFKKPPAIEANPLKDFLEDADLAGTPFIGYARKVVKDQASIGRGVTIVDWSDADQRPYVAFYPGEDVINWRQERIGGTIRLTMLVVRETIEEVGSDEYAPTMMEQFRSFRLVKATPGTEDKPGTDGYVVAEVWKRAKTVNRTNSPETAAGTGTTNASEATMTKMETRTMARNGRPLPDIPAVWHGADENSPVIGKAPLAAIANVNVAHFRNSADLENGRHVAGIPTPYACGFVEPGTKLYLGSSHAWISTDKDAQCGFLEFEGQGLNALKEGLEEKQSQMASLGARLIEPRQKDAEAYETVQLRASAETSALARIGILGSESLTSALCWAAWWVSPGAEHPDSLKEQVNIVLNKDFTSSAMDPAMLRELVSSFQQSAISRDTLFHNLQRGEIIPEGVTLEEELDRIEASPPIAPPVAVDPNKIDPATGLPFPPAPKPAPGGGAAKKTAAKKTARAAA
jgi:hypothetical protein